MRINGYAIVAVLLAGGLFGCGSQVVPPSGPHPATEAAAVQLYAKEPARYEDLGIVSVAQDVLHDKDFSFDRIVDTLKAQAAARGANGVLIFTPTEQDQDMLVLGAYYRGEFYHFPVREKPTMTAVLKAIYVLKE